MQSQEAYGSRTRVTSNSNDDFEYGRGDIPIFNFDEADRVLIATLQELIEALRYEKTRFKLPTRNNSFITSLLK